MRKGIFTSMIRRCTSRVSVTLRSALIQHASFSSAKNTTTAPFASEFSHRATALSQTPCSATVPIFRCQHTRITSPSLSTNLNRCTTPLQCNTRFFSITKKQLLGVTPIRYQNQQQQQAAAAAESLRIDLLERALKYVQQHGWTHTAIAEAAKELGLSPQSHGLVLGGPTELISYYVDKCNKRMSEEVLKLDLQCMTSKAIVKECIKQRLLLNAEYVVTGRWSEAMALYCFPQVTFPDSPPTAASNIEKSGLTGADLFADNNNSNSGEQQQQQQRQQQQGQQQQQHQHHQRGFSNYFSLTAVLDTLNSFELPQVQTLKALQQLLYLVDDICVLAGQNDTDFNWYTKRFAIAAIYIQTELFMLRDASPDFKETWRFLDSSVDEAVEMKHKIEGFAQLLKIALAAKSNRNNSNRSSADFAQYYTADATAAATAAADTTSATTTATSFTNSGDINSSSGAVNSSSNNSTSTSANANPTTGL